MIPNSVTSIGSYAFYDCTSLSAITVGTNNPSYCSVDGVLFNKSKNTLIQYPAGKAAGSYSLPDSVTNIASSAFYGCANLTGITIGTNVTSIGSSAFYNCTRLTAVCFQGNAPGGGSDSSVFSGDNSATVYYLPGTTGWHSPFDSCRALLWNPQPQTSGTSFGVRTNRFGFTIIGQQQSGHRGGSLHGSGQFHLVSGGNQHAQHFHRHQRHVLFQRSEVDELSRSFLPPPFAVTNNSSREHLNSCRKFRFQRVCSHECCRIAHPD